MGVLTAVMVFSALGAVICTKARAAGPAVFFAVVAVALFAVSPAGAQLPGAVADLVAAFRQAAAEGGAP